MSAVPDVHLHRPVSYATNNTELRIDSIARAGHSTLPINEDLRIQGAYSCSPNALSAAVSPLRSSSGGLTPRNAA